MSNCGECCGTCGNNTCDDGEFVCGCEASDAYGCSTSYTDHCEEWCEKYLAVKRVQG